MGTLMENEDRNALLICYPLVVVAGPQNKLAEVPLLEPELDVP
jgi:hypothetical protein